VVLLLVAACSGTAEGGGGETEPDEGELADCAPDETATVYACGDGWAITWPGQTMVCGAPDGPCALDASVLVAACESGGWALSFPVDPPTCVVDNTFDVGCINPPEDVCGRTCSGLEFVGCACAAECPSEPGMVRSCHATTGVCALTDPADL
jgi:hypothetical protein